MKKKETYKRYKGRWEGGSNQRYDGDDHRELWRWIIITITNSLAKKKNNQTPPFRVAGRWKAVERRGVRQISEQICEPVFVVEEKEGSQDIAEKRHFAHLTGEEASPFCPSTRNFIFLPKSNLIVARAGGAHQIDDLGKYDRSGSGWIHLLLQFSNRLVQSRYGLIKI